MDLKVTRITSRLWQEGARLQSPLVLIGDRGKFLSKPQLTHEMGTMTPGTHGSLQMKIKPLERRMSGGGAAQASREVATQLRDMPDLGSAALSGGWVGGAEHRLARGQPPRAAVLPGHRFQNGSPERDLQKAVRSGWISGLSGV